VKYGSGLDERQRMRCFCMFCDVIGRDYATDEVRSKAREKKASQKQQLKVVTRLACKPYWVVRDQQFNRY